MLDGLPIDLGNLSGWGVVAIFVVALLTGRLTSRREVDAEKARADTWQEAWDKAMAANRAKDEHQGELLENSRTTVRILEAIRQQANTGRGDSG